MIEDGNETGGGGDQPAPGDGQPAQGRGESEGAVCVYDGRTYKPGDRVCIDREWHVCSQQGTWEPTGQSCS